MAIYVRVHRPAADDVEQGAFHGMTGEVAGFAITSDHFARNRVLVAMEDGTLATFSPRELRAGKVVYNRRPE